MMHGFMFDTTVFNHILRDEVDVTTMPAGDRLFVTHVQLNEIQETKNEAKRSQLLAVFTEVAAQKVATESALWDVSEWDEAKFSDEALNRSIYSLVCESTFPDNSSRNTSI